MYDLRGTRYDLLIMCALSREAERRRRDGYFLQQGLTSQFSQLNHRFPSFVSLFACSTIFLFIPPCRMAQMLAVEEPAVLSCSQSRSCGVLTVSFPDGTILSHSMQNQLLDTSLAHHVDGASFMS